MESLPEQENRDDEEWWRRHLLEGHKSVSLARRAFRYLPSHPRCKECYVPFGGIGGAVTRPLGWRPSRKNPKLCELCCERLPTGGAEVDVAVLFADVRGSTELGE